MSSVTERARKQFPILATRTYLNSCSYGALCVEVKAAVEEYLDTRINKGSDWGHWVEQLEISRTWMARLLMCSADDVSVSTSVSESVNSLASALDFQGQRNTIVVTEFDFPTTSQIWLAQSRRGARVVRANADESGTDIPLRHFEELVDERTLLVSIPSVCYRNGVRLDPRPIIDLCHERGALVMLDAYQGIGSIPIDVRDLKVDFLTSGCLKYLIGTAGIAFMYVRDAGHSLLQPISTGWFAQENIGQMDIYHHRPAATARRFESGTPNVIGLYAVSAGLKVLLDVGMDEIDKQVRLLTAGLARRVRQHGWELVTPEQAERHGAMMVIRSTDAPLLVKRLFDAGIVVSDRDGCLRVAPHFYNNESDLDHLVEVLEANPALLAARN